MAPATPQDICKHIIQTSRLTLHLYDTSEVDQSTLILNVFNDPVALAKMGDYGLRTNNSIVSLCTALHLRPNAHHTILSTEGFFYIIHIGVDVPASDTASMVGFISLMQRDDESAPDIGWVLLNQFAGKGYATEASKEALRHWSQDISGLENIRCIMSPTNGASRQVALKIGLEENERKIVNQHTGKENLVFTLPGTKKEVEKDAEST
ncbi:hypothetical protein FIBSPDRAFT_1036190 [Athelia psychrophila]|uniref:N-acetyltransferase domain-containing protein n=1 Tax=Athelia psychrophila TaxID=1759441 RepID=A0A166WE79_9AGAM|nr:hypothetical protein FIBSPDRAFT_1036190 [Fibularhizoctonia sp. CBS 109695]